MIEATPTMIKDIEEGLKDLNVKAGDKENPGKDKLTKAEEEKETWEDKKGRRKLADRGRGEWKKRKGERG